MSSQNLENEQYEIKDEEIINNNNLENPIEPEIYEPINNNEESQQNKNIIIFNETRIKRINEII